jgi:type IV secretion system protein VirB8
MKSRKNTDSSRIEHAVGRAVNYEVTLADDARRSERRAWRVAGCSVVLSLVLAGGYFFMLPLKERVPYLVMADAAAGTATVARLNGGLNQTSISRSEAVNRSNVAHYVLSREGYDLAMIKLRDWTVVYTMSAPDVARSYQAANSTQNPESPFNVYGRDKSIRVQINSIQMIGGENGTQPKGATVRFQRSVYDKTNGWTDFLDNRIATIEFTYKNLSMDEKQRIENPLGFQVTSYRVDTDYSSTPPPAVARATAAAPAGTGAPAEMLPAAMQAPPTAPGTPQATAMTVPQSTPVAAGNSGAVPSTATPQPAMRSANPGSASAGTNTQGALR